MGLPPIYLNRPLPRVMRGILSKFGIGPLIFLHTPHFMEEFRSPLLIRSGPIIYGSRSAPSGYAFSQVKYCWKNPNMDYFGCSPQVSIVEVFSAIFLIWSPNLIILVFPPHRFLSCQDDFITPFCGFRETSVPEL